MRRDDIDTQDQRGRSAAPSRPRSWAVFITCHGGSGWNRLDTECGNQPYSWPPGSLGLGRRSGSGFVRFFDLSDPTTLGVRRRTLATRDANAGFRYFAESQLWRGIIFPGVVAVGALAIAILAAILNAGSGEVGGLNIFVETLSGTSSTFVGGTFSILPLGFAFVAGMVSTFNPCGFAMLPAYLGLYLRVNEQEGAKATPARRLGRALLVGGTVTAGFVVLFGVTGILFGSGGRFLVNIFPWLGLAIGILLILTGAWLSSGAKTIQRIRGPGGRPNRDARRGGFPRLFSIRDQLWYRLSELHTPNFSLAVVGSTLAVGGILAALGQFVLYALGMGMSILVLTLATRALQGGCRRSHTESLALRPAGERRVHGYCRHLHRVLLAHHRRTAGRRSPSPICRAVGYRVQDTSRFYSSRSLLSVEDDSQARTIRYLYLPASRQPVDSRDQRFFRSYRCLRPNGSTRR